MPVDGKADLGISVGRFDHHVETNLRSNITANWVGLNLRIPAFPLPAARELHNGMFQGTARKHRVQRWWRGPIRQLRIEPRTTAAFLLLNPLRSQLVENLSMENVSSGSGGPQHRSRLTVPLTTNSVSKVRIPHSAIDSV